MEFKQYSTAIACFKKAILLKGCSPMAYTSLARLYLEIKDDAAAFRLLSGVRIIGYIAAEKDDISGDALYNLGRFKEARAAYARAIKALPYDTRIESKLGLTEVRIGMKKVGFTKLRHALADAPQSLEMHDRLIKACISANMLEEADDLAYGVRHPKAYLRAASIRVQLKQFDLATGMIVEGLHSFPESGELRLALAELSTH